MIQIKYTLDTTNGAILEGEHWGGKYVVYQDEASAIRDAIPIRMERQRSVVKSKRQEVRA